MKHFKSTIMVPTLCLFFILSGCSGDSSHESEHVSVNITGTWFGTWVSEDGLDHGNTTLTLTQNGSTTSGQVTFSGSSCLPGGTVSGAIAGNNVAGSVTTGESRVDLNITITNNQMNGTFNVVSAGDCTGYSGTFTAD